MSCRELCPPRARTKVLLPLQSTYLTAMSFPAADDVSVFQLDRYFHPSAHVIILNSARQLQMFRMPSQTMTCGPLAPEVRPRSSETSLWSRCVRRRVYPTRYTFGQSTSTSLSGSGTARLQVRAEESNGHRNGSMVFPPPHDVRLSQPASF